MVIFHIYVTSPQSIKKNKTYFPFNTGVSESACQRCVASASFCRHDRDRPPLSRRRPLDTCRSNRSWICGHFFKGRCSVMMNQRMVSWYGVFLTQKVSKIHMYPCSRNVVLFEEKSQLEIMVAAGSSSQPMDVNPENPTLADWGSSSHPVKLRRCEKFSDNLWTKSGLAPGQGFLLLRFKRFQREDTST